jgi:hypothetical protein
VPACAALGIEPLRGALGRPGARWSPVFPSVQPLHAEPAGALAPRNRAIYRATSQQPRSLLAGRSATGVYCSGIFQEGAEVDPETPGSGAASGRPEGRPTFRAVRPGGRPALDSENAWSSAGVSTFAEGRSALRVTVLAFGTLWALLHRSMAYNAMLTSEEPNFTPLECVPL